MKKNLGKILPALIFIMISVMVLIACQSKTNSSVTNQQPLEVVSVQAPMLPINYGGPNVEIILKNVANEPVVSLMAVFDNLGPPYFYFNFDVGTSNPLLPGESVNRTQALMNAGFGDGVLYPLTMTGTLQSGATFSYTKQVKIVEPTN